VRVSPEIHATLAPAEARRTTEKGNFVARPRWQGGWLFKRGKKNPVWVFRFREDAIAENGLRIRRQRSVVLGRTREISKRHALRMASERLGAINQGRHKPELMSTFERFVLDRWEINTIPMLRFSTARNYKNIIQVHLIPFFGQMRLSEIGSADVQLFLAEKAKTYAPKTVLTMRNLLSKIFGTAQKWSYLQTNPAQGTQVPSQIAVRERLTLTPEQVRALFDELEEMYRTMVLLAVLSGLRRGEIFGLRWKCVSFQEGSIIVSEANYEGHAAAPKTRASCRKVFVDAVVIDALTNLRPSLHRPEDLVFHTGRGTALNPNNVLNRVLHPACKRAGIPVVSWHNFRYTFATWANPTGESIKALQSQLGHTDQRLTLNVYTQPMPEAQKLLAGKVARVLLPVAPKCEITNETVQGLLN
jgi:integrase